MPLEVNAPRLLSDLKTLASFGKSGRGVTRIAYSAEDIEARQWLAARFSEAGLESGIDQIGNVVGRARAISRALLIGSHTDSVPTGGWLDGSLGVIYGLEIARRAREENLGGDLGIDVVSFQDEEGTYVGWLGSRFACGELTIPEVEHIRSPSGEALGAALSRLPPRFAPSLDLGRYGAYLEAHIEQGPYLENTGTNIGIVTSIVGIRNYVLRFFGRADHAGTTPMDMRIDAGTQMFDFVHRFRAALETLRGPKTVWNFGSATFRPGFNNVVPAEAELLVQYRDPSSSVLSDADTAMGEVLAEIEQRHACKAEMQVVMRTEPVPMDRSLGICIEAAAADVGASSVWMPSGAGHDAAAIGKHVPAAMLFIPSIGGRSHTADEDSHEIDIVRGANVALNAARRIIAAAP